jgi:hypothetical protein
MMGVSKIIWKTLGFSHFGISRNLEYWHNFSSVDPARESHVRQRRHLRIRRIPVRTAERAESCDDP